MGLAASLFSSAHHCFLRSLYQRVCQVKNNDVARDHVHSNGRKFALCRSPDRDQFDRESVLYELVDDRVARGRFVDHFGESKNALSELSVRWNSAGRYKERRPVHFEFSSKHKCWIPGIQSIVAVFLRDRGDSFVVFRACSLAGECNKPAPPFRILYREYQRLHQQS